MTGDNKLGVRDPSHPMDLQNVSEPYEFMDSVVVPDSDPPKLVKEPWYETKQKQENKLCPDCGELLCHRFTYLEHAIDNSYHKIPTVNPQTNQRNSIILEYVCFVAVENIT